jgi:hypothetical protein
VVPPGEVGGAPRLGSGWKTRFLAGHDEQCASEERSAPARVTLLYTIRRSYNRKTFSKWLDIGDEVEILVVFVLAAITAAYLLNIGDEFDGANPLHLLVTQLIFDA